MQALADKDRSGLSPGERADAPHSQDAAHQAVALIRQGRADALMKRQPVYR